MKKFILLFIINSLFSNEITTINESEEAIASKQNYIVFSDTAFLVAHKLAILDSTPHSKKYSMMAFAIGFLLRMNSWNDYQIKPNENKDDEDVDKNKKEVIFDVNKWNE